MHVIHTTPSIAEHSGGPVRCLRDLSEAQSRAGARVSLVASYDLRRDPVLVRSDPDLVTTELLPAERRFGAVTSGFGASVARLAAAESPAILHDHGMWLPANLQATAAGRRAGLRYVVSPHGMLKSRALAHRGGRKKVAWRLYQRGALMRAAGLVAAAEPERAEMRPHVGRLPIAVIPNGVPVPASLPERSHRLADQPRTLLFLSRIHPIKNILGLLDAWAAVAVDPTFSNWTLRIAGPDESHRAEVEAAAERLVLTNRVTFEGPVAEAHKAAAFALADLFVLPSLTENFGIVVAEALAAGLPVVASRGSPWSALSGEKCGWWAGPDPQELATALRDAMSRTPADRLEMGRRGYAYVARTFGLDPIAARTLTYYEWLLHGGPTPEFVDV